MAEPTVARSYVKMELRFLMLNLTKTERAVLVYLVQKSGFSGAARVTQAEVAADLGINIRTVADAYRKLQEAEVMATEGHGRCVFNPCAIMSGTEDKFGMKLSRFRAAANKKSRPGKETFTPDEESYLRAVMVDAGPVNSDEDEWTPATACGDE